MEKNRIKKGLLAISLGVAVWLVFQLCTSGEHLKNGLLLCYVASVIFMLVMELKGKGAAGVSSLSETETKEPQEIILQIIHEKGRAKRQDILPHLRMSKSTLVRLLDKMEEKGIIEQVRDRKGSYYRPKQA